MTPRQAYETDLRRHLEGCRKNLAIPSRDSLSSQEEAQCRVLGGHLIQWLSELGPQLLQERAILSEAVGWDKQPLVCLLSDVPGLVAAREILGNEPVPVVWGFLADFESFPIKDPEFMYHVELHSRFIPLSSEALDPQLRRKHPLSLGEEYLIHREESVLGPLFARGAHHLWKWDGRELVLLEEAFETWVS